MSGPKIKLNKQVKYLGVYKIIFTGTVIYLISKKKLNRAIGLFLKVRHYVPKDLLRTRYYSFFNSHLVYASEIWVKNFMK